MYYPKQIPYLLDKSFQDNISYKEYQLNNLEEFCMCIWQMQSKQEIQKTIYNYILPDACIDIVIDFSKQNIYFAGFSKETVPFELNEKVDYMGVRLKPSCFYLLYGISADKIMDHSLDFAKIEDKKQLFEIFDVTEQRERVNILKEYIKEKIKYKPTKKYINLVEQLYENPKEQNVIALATSLGYDKRHLYRIFKTYYGVSPKVLLNIIRLHLCLTLMLEQYISLIEIATICGFYDQAHFIKEVKKYTGFSPLQLLKNINMS